MEKTSAWLLERTSPGLLFLLIGFSATFPRHVMTARQPCRRGDRRDGKRVYLEHTTPALALRKSSGQERLKDSPPQIYTKIVQP